MSDELGFTSDEAIFYLSQVQLENFIFTVTLTLAVHDTILSFPKEVKSFDCVRIWSIYQHAWIPTVLVFVLSMFEPAINIDLCNLGRFDILKYSQASLNSFSILLLLNIFAVLLDILAVSTQHSNPNASEFVVIQQVLTSIILSHFILSLRSTYHTTNNLSQTSSKQSSLHFASAVEGNMGASLSGSWSSNREEDEEEPEEVQYSDYPFAAGLADIKETGGDENMEEIPEAGCISLSLLTSITTDNLLFYFKPIWHHS
ncbi:hypothetical protein QCA50_008278 [Cerrena zonata]|uniref:Uncharacterized protein n=1 Tax=Cerrena zonata TaxID=2478898 RepID=A0AAW0GAU7_9APHY